MGGSPPRQTADIRDFVENCVRANVDRMGMRLRGASEPVLIDPPKAGRLRLVGSSYSLDAGMVEFFDEG